MYYFTVVQITVIRNGAKLGMKIIKNGNNLILLITIFFEEYREYLIISSAVIVKHEPHVQQESPHLLCVCVCV